MQKGMPGASRTYRGHGENYLGENFDGKIAEFILVPTTHPASSTVISNAIKFLNGSFECVEKSQAGDRAVRPDDDVGSRKPLSLRDAHGLRTFPWRT